MAEPELLDKRLLECIQGKRIFPLYRSVDGLRHASPALSFAKLPTQQETQHLRQFE
jgi:hypothetical protein